jgi:prevent-host-death family protein
VRSIAIDSDDCKVYTLYVHQEKEGAALVISVKEARKRFSELLDRVLQGEEVVVLRRGKEVARLVPPEKSIKCLPDLSEFRQSIGQQGTSAVELIREERERR